MKEGEKREEGKREEGGRRERDGRGEGQGCGWGMTQEGRWDPFKLTTSEVKARSEDTNEGRKDGDQREFLTRRFRSQCFWFSVLERHLWNPPPSSFLEEPTASQRQNKLLGSSLVRVKRRSREFQANSTRREGIEEKSHEIEADPKKRK